MTDNLDKIKSELNSIDDVLKRGLVEQLDQDKTFELILSLSAKIQAINSYLFSSILEGEYYLANCHEKLSQIEKVFNSIKEKVKLNDIFNLSSGIQNISFFLKNLKFLNQYVIDRSKSLYDKLIFNFELDKILNYKNDEDYSLNWLFSINVKLAQFDEGYTSNLSNYKLLAEIHYDLNNSIESEKLLDYIEVIKKLSFKCALFIYKIYCRDSKNNKTNYLEGSILSHDGVEKIKNEIKDFVIDDNVKLGAELIKRIDDHYFSNSVDLKSLINAPDPDISTLHWISKGINNSNDGKVSKKDYQRYLEQQLKIQKNKLLNIPGKSEYIKESNEIAYKSIINTLSNSLIACRLDESLIEILDKQTFDNFNRLHEKSVLILEEILQKYSFDDIPNFMIYVKYLNFVINSFDKIGKNKLKNYLSTDINYSQKLINIFDNSYKYLEKFRNNIIKFKDLGLMPIYVEIDKCYSKGIFIDSQHILPSDFDNLMEKHDDIRNKLKELERLVIFSAPDSTIALMKKDVNESMKDSQYNVITIIGLYAAFITFVLSSTSVLPRIIGNNGSIGAVMLFILIVGFVLFYFVGTLKVLFSTRKTIKLKSIKYDSISVQFVWLLISTIVFALAIINIQNKHGIIDFEKPNKGEIITDTVGKRDILLIDSVSKDYKKQIIVIENK